MSEQGAHVEIEKVAAQADIESAIASMQNELWAEHEPKVLRPLREIWEAAITRLRKDPMAHLQLEHFTKYDGSYYSDRFAKPNCAIGGWGFAVQQYADNGTLVGAHIAVEALSLLEDMDATREDIGKVREILQGQAQTPIRSKNAPSLLGQLAVKTPRLLRKPLWEFSEPYLRDHVATRILDTAQKLHVKVTAETYGHDLPPRVVHDFVIDANRHTERPLVLRPDQIPHDRERWEWFDALRPQLGRQFVEETMRESVAANARNLNLESSDPGWTVQNYLKLRMVCQLLDAAIPEAPSIT